MNVGYNTNIPYKGKTYHVQTEDCGLKNPVVLTLLYYEGAILASRKTEYAGLLEDPDRTEKVQELMKLQHKIMIKELIHGKHAQEAEGEELQEAALEPGEEPGRSGGPEKGQIKNSLDDILLDFILKKHK